MNLRLIVFYCILITSLIYSYDENNMADLIVPTQIAPKHCPQVYKDPFR